MININKSIRLIGENKVNTIINDSRISIVVSEVFISGFTIQNGSGITIDSYSSEDANNNTISNGNFSNNYVGIYVVFGKQNTIINNTVSSNAGGSHGIKLEQASGWNDEYKIIGNKINYNYLCGIQDFVIFFHLF